jgi:hypothetical protein
MHQVTSEQLLSFLSEHEPPCISLYQHTHRHHPESQQDPIRYRNLLRAMEASLREKYGTRAVRPIMERFQAYARDDEFWNHRTDGLAILASPDLFEIVELQRPVSEQMIVAETFYVKPLLRILQSADRYQVLCLTRDRAELYEGNRDALDPVDLVDTPATLADALGEELTQPRQAVRSAPGQTPVYHGAGQKKDEVDADRDRFFRAVDRGVLEHHSKPSGLPLMLAALTQYHAPFRGVSHNPLLMDEGIFVDPASVGVDQLRALAWEKVEPLYLDRLSKLIESYQRAQSRDMGFDDIDEVAAATVAGRVGALLVEADRQIPGRVDPSSGHIEHGDLADPEIGDVLNDLATTVLRMKGEVVMVPHARMPSNTGLAATYRF